MNKSTKFFSFYCKQMTFGKFVPSLLTKPTTRIDWSSRVTFCEIFIKLETVIHHSAWNYLTFPLFQLFVKFIGFVSNSVCVESASWSIRNANWIVLEGKPSKGTPGRFQHCTCDRFIYGRYIWRERCTPFPAIPGFST